MGKSAATVFQGTLALPPGFRPGDILSFHARDTEEVGEAVSADGLRKGLLWHGQPAELAIRFYGTTRAEISLAVDGASSAGSPEALETLARRILGLTQPVEAFEAAYGAHPHLGPLIARNPGLRLPVTTTPFEALTWAITGQQISVSAAVSVRRRLIRVADRRHSGGLFCYPDAETVLGLPEDSLRGAGLSRTKAATFHALARGVLDGSLPLDGWLETVPAEEISAALLATPGIGPWTVSYGLLRGYGWLDGSLHGDVAVRRGLAAFLDRTDKIDAREAEAWLAAFSPWRALVAAHLWKVPTGRPGDPQDP